MIDLNKATNEELRAELKKRDLLMNIFSMAWHYMNGNRPEPSYTDEDKKKWLRDLVQGIL